MSQPIALDQRNITAGYDSKTKILTVVAVVPDGTVPSTIARIGFERGETMGGRCLKLTGYPDGPSNPSRRIQVNPYTETITQPLRFSNVSVETDKGSDNVYTIPIGAVTPAPGPSQGPLPAKTPSTGGTVPPPSSSQLLPWAREDIFATYERNGVGEPGTLRVFADGIVPSSIASAAFELDKSFTGIGRRVRLVGSYGGLATTKGMQRLQVSPYIEKVDPTKSRGNVFVVTSQREDQIEVIGNMIGRLNGHLDMPPNQGATTLDSSTTKLPTIVCELTDTCYARVTATVPDFQVARYEIEARSTSDALRVWRAGALPTKLYWDITWTKGDPGKPVDFIVTAKTWPVGTGGKNQVTVQVYTAKFEKKIESMIDYEA